MEIILLENGQGLLTYEVQTVATDSVICTLIGDSTPSILSITDGNRTIRKPIRSNFCEIDLAPFMNKNVKIVATAKDKIWDCGSIRIERLKDGGVRIRSLANYAGMLKECFAEISRLKKSFDDLGKVVEELRTKGTNKTYKIT